MPNEKSRRWLALPCLVLALGSGLSLAKAQAGSVEVVRRGVDPTEPEILTVRRPRRSPPRVVHSVPVIVRDTPPPRTTVVVTTTTTVDPPADPEPADDVPVHPVWVRSAAYVDFVDFSDLNLAFGDPEVTAVQGSRLTPLDGRRGMGGGMLTLGGEVGEFLRLPELRVTLGGGLLDSAWSPVIDSGDDLLARATSVFAVKAELLAGAHVQLGPLRPFASIRAGYAGYFFEVDVAHADLGALGSETIAEGRWEVGVDAGAGLQVGEGIRATLAYRRTFVGADAHGISLGLELAMPGL